MKKTLLLCFIHGFKGDDNTFGDFPEHLRAIVSHSLPKVTVSIVTYPKFETRGDLKECVGRFREWLQNRVIDLEVEARTPSPTVDPSVRTILIGHSMGGIVGAETVLAIHNETPLPSAKSSPSASETLNKFMFPYIQGLLALDTPYLGIAPGVVANQAEGHYKTMTQLSGLAGSLWGGNEAAKATSPNTNPPKGIAGVLPEAPNGAAAIDSKKDDSPAGTDAAAIPAWQRWGKVAMFAGAAGAVAAGGAAAYFKRDVITESITGGRSWIGSHLEFVGCLIRGEELKRRLAGVMALRDEGFGFTNLYTVLSDEQRTFCNVPKSPSPSRMNTGKTWMPTQNPKASDEIGAHMSLFFPNDNPYYYALSDQAKERIVLWMQNDWYESATPGDDDDDDGFELTGKEGF